MVSGHHHLRKGKPLQKAARRRKLIGTGPLGQIAAHHEGIGLLAPDPRADGRVEGIEVGRPKMDIRNMKQPNVHSILQNGTLWITGTDTGVGKTAVSAALALTAFDAGLDWRYFKPAETGADYDSDFVAKATGEPGRVISGYQFQAPLAPLFAAETVQAVVSPSRLDKLISDLREARPLLVEGPGGALTPYAEGVNGAALAVRWKLTALVVAENRLGCLNHLLLTLEALERRGIPVAGVVFNDLDRASKSLANPDYFRRLSEVPVLAWLPPLTGGKKPSAAWWHEGEARANRP